MKTGRLLALLTLASLGCAPQPPAQLTPQEQDVVKSEIRAIQAQILQACAELNLEAGMRPYWDSPDFVFISTEGAVMNYEEVKSASAAFFDLLSSLKYTMLKDDFRFLPDGLVLYTVSSSAEMTLKTGETGTVAMIVVTLLFKKIDGRWRIIYSHESGLPPVFS